MIGQVFLKRYVVQAAIGQGSMGRIYLAQDQVGRRPVVLKLMNPQLAGQPRFRQQFQEELDCMRRLSHPGIVALLDGSLDDPNGPCLVLEHVRGLDLECLRKRQPGRRFSPARIGRLVGQLCEALQSAHSLGIIHRDLKPANLMVVDWGQPLERIKVMDFGLAKWVEDFASPAEKAAGRLRPTGAAGYISPEQIRGGPVDARSDLYSVGVILFELLTGRLPFRRPSVAETLQAHLGERPPRFAEIDPALHLPPAVEAVVQLCLAKEPGGRPGSALDLGQRFERALGQSILGTTSPAAPPAAAPPRPAGSAPPVVQRPRPTLPGTPVVQQPRPTLPGTPVVQQPRPTLPGTPAVQRPSRSTFHDVPPPPPTSNETTVLVPGFRPDAGSVASLAGFVQELGGRLVEKSPGSMRALLPVNLNADASGFARGGAGSGSVQLVLTELEFRWEPQRAEQALRLAFRPLGGVSISLANAWRGGCERVQAQLQDYLQG